MRARRSPQSVSAERRARPAMVKGRQGVRRLRLQSCRAAWLPLLLALGAAARAQDIAPFRVTSVEGHNTIRYLRDGFVSAQPGLGLVPPVSTRAQSDWREELYVLTQAYVYHPNLLSLELGLGPVLQRASYQDDSTQTVSTAVLANLSARVHVLRDKPVNGSLFYEHLNPTVLVGPGEVMSQQTTRWGANFSAGAGALPVTVFADASHMQTLGRGVDRVIDDQADQFSMRATRGLDKFGTTQLQLHAARQSSASGSSSLPIQATNAASQDLNLDTRLHFGPAALYELTNVVTLAQQSFTRQGDSPVPDRQDRRLLLDLQARHFPWLQSYGSYSWAAADQGSASTSRHALTTGVNWAPRGDFAASAAVHADRNTMQHVTSTARAADASVRYQTPLPVGSLQAAYSIRQEQREQSGVAGATQVIGDRFPLAGSAWATLIERYVVAGSVTVFNATRTQRYIEGVDYTLMVVGNETRVQRRVGGAILDGQEVLLDYYYDEGGSFTASQTDHRFDFNWSINSNINAYFHYQASSPRLLSGQPSYPLNTVRGSTWGLRGDWPLNLDYDATVGLGVETEYRQETMANFHRSTVDAYAQMEEPFLGLGHFSLGLRLNRVDYGNPGQDIDVRGWDLRYWTRFPPDVELSAWVNEETDVGGLVPRRRSSAGMKADWRYRKLRMSMDMGRTVEKHGNARRAPSHVQVQARRDF
jgi:hypothetical protein